MRKMFGVWLACLVMTGVAWAGDGKLTVSIQTPSQANEADGVTFAANASNGAPPYSYAWSFGDGTSASEANPKHSFADNGVFVVTLTVTDAAGSTASAMKPIAVANVPPVVSLGVPKTGQIGQLLDFTGLAQDASPADQAFGLFYLWDFGDGATSAQASPSHAYAAKGTYNVSLVAFDRDGGVSVAATGTVVIAPPYSIDAGPNVAVNEGAAMAFSPVVTGGTAPFTYYWNFGDGNAGPSAVPNPAYTYKDSGTYIALVSVTDATGATTADTVTVKVANVAPVVAVSGPATGNTGRPITFVAGVNEPSFADWSAGFSYSWDFGDGQTSTESAISDVISHSYAQPGTYTVKATVTDKDGAASAAGTATIAITAPTVVNIDQPWLDKRTPPYVLNQAGATYVLQTDVTVPGSAFQISASNVTFDLNGHTVVYDNTDPIPVQNGGFESGDLAGWDVSKATTAKVIDARTGMWGSKMLHVDPFTTPQAVASDPISIPQAGIRYTAAITPRTGDYQTTVALSVVDSVTGAVLATGKSSNPNRGFSPVVGFTPTTTNAVILSVTATPSAGASDYLDLDYASLTRSTNYGVSVEMYRNYTNTVIKNGTIAQGTGRSYASSPVFVREGKKVTIDGLSLSASGMDTYLFEGIYGRDVRVANSIFTASLDRISNRMLLIGAIDVSNSYGSIVIDGNAITGTTECGVVFSRNASDPGPIVVRNNVIKHTAIVTEGYGIASYDGFNHFEIAKNVITPDNGRGILFDNAIFFGSVHDNQIDVKEKANLEYAGTGLEVAGLRLRPFSPRSQRDTLFVNNTFSASTGIGAAWAATGARINIVNTNAAADWCNLVFLNNTFKAVVTGIDPNYAPPRKSMAWGLTLSNGALKTGMTFRGNTFAGNAVSLNLGDNDSWQGVTGDLRFVGNTITKSADGITVPYRGVVVGDWETEVHGVLLADAQYANGATADLVFTGSRPKDLSIGRTLSLAVTDRDKVPVSGSQVVVQSNGGVAIYQGATDVNGKLSVPLVTDTCSVPANGNNQKPSRVTNTPVTITATSGGKSGSVTVQDETTVTITVQ